MVNIGKAVTINRDAEFAVKIFKADDDTLVDTIKPKGETQHTWAEKQWQTVNVDDQLVQAAGNVLLIKPHSAKTDGKTVLEPDTAYYVQISGDLVAGYAGIADKSWKFTTKSAPSISEKNISVGKSGDFYSIQGALNYLADKKDAYTITVEKGDYHERLSYYGDASAKIVGPESDYGKDVRVFWRNNEALKNTGGRKRTMFLWEGKNLTIENMTFRNTTNRETDGTNNVQAETFYFDSTSDLIVYNSSFSSYQDTLLIGNNGGRAWFYKCHIEGDVDFIWGYANVALFENCKIVCLADGIKNSAYIFASRTPANGDTVSKGFVLLNSTVEIQNACNAYYGRSSGADTQASIIGNTFTTVGTGKLNSALWEKPSDTVIYELSGDMAVGYKDTNNKLNGYVVATDSRKENTQTISDRVLNREYNGRWVIFNRVYNPTSGAYEFAKDTTFAGSDITTVANEYGAAAEDSKDNIYVEPVFSKNIVGGNTVKITPTSKKEDLTYTYASSDTSLATVANDGTVTTVEKASGTVSITATASNGKKDTAQIAVIAEVIKAQSVAITVEQASMPKFGVQTARIAITPQDTTVKTVTLTTSDNKLKFYDPETKTFVNTVTTQEDEVLVWASDEVSDATITAKSAEYETATAGTATVSTTANITEYQAAEGLARGGMGTGTVNFQSGNNGIWEDLICSSNTSITGFSANGKFQVNTTPSIQARNVVLYVPVNGASKITISTDRGKDEEDLTSDAKHFAVGNTKFAAASDKYTYTYTYDGSKTGIVLGHADEISGIQLTKGTGGKAGVNTKYLKVAVVGADRYITAIRVEKTGNFTTSFDAVAEILGASGTYSFMAGGLSGELNGSTFTSTDGYVAASNVEQHNDHGFTTSASTVITIRIPGKVKISIGACQYGNAQTVTVTKNGETVTTLENCQAPEGSDGKPCEATIFTVDSTGAADLALAFSGGGWIHNIAVEAVE
ncbi:MAG: hypothetical protein K2O09_03875 [Treponemataceae bacterium]|nr:hypothetical protein [Treponemataceae bacterium]